MQFPRWRIINVFFLWAIASSSTYAITPVLLRDINDVQVGDSSNPVFLGPLNGSMYVAARAPGNGTEIWRLNGNTPTMIGEVFPGTGLYTVGPFFSVHGRTLFEVSSGSARSVWETDGTAAGTRQLYVVAGTYVRSIGRFRDFQIFEISGPAAQPNQIVSIDLLSGVRQVLCANAPDSTLPERSSVIIAGDFLYLLDRDAATNEVRMFTSDGTAAGTRVIPYKPDFPYAQISWVANDEALYFLGAVPGTYRQLFRLPHGSNVAQQLTSFADRAPTDILYTFGSQVLFFIPFGDAFQMWRSDGSVAGTIPLTYFRLGGASGLYFAAGGAGDRMVLATRDDAGRATLIGTDGTVAGTVPLFSGDPPALTGATYVANFEGHAYLALNNGSVFRTDGTQGSFQQLPIPPLSASDITVSAVTFGDKLMLHRGSFGGNRELFSYDPATDQATSLGVHGSLASILPWNGNLYFQGFTLATGEEPWVSDGTSAGTRLIANLQPAFVTRGSDPVPLAVYGGVFYFSANDGVHGRELWRTDGTDAGTVRITDIAPGARSSFPGSLRSVGDYIIFWTGQSAGDEVDMWGYHPSTGVLENIALTTTPSCISEPLATLGGDRLFYTSGGGASQIRRTDGTAAGTSTVMNQSSNSTAYASCNFLELNGHVYFTSLGPINDPNPFTYKLWELDVISGFARLVDHAGYGFFHYSGALAWENAIYLFRSIQSEWGLVRVDDPAGTTESIGPNLPAQPGFLPRGDQLFIRAGYIEGASRLHTYTAGEAQLRELSPLNFVSLAVDPIGSEYPLVTAASSSTRELSMTDGTAAGTRFVGALPGDIERCGKKFLGVVLCTSPQALVGTDGTAAGTREWLRSTPQLDLRANTLIHTESLAMVAMSTADSGAELYRLENDRPVLSNDTLAVTAGNAGTVRILDNDSDPEGLLDLGSLTIVGTASHGAVTMSADGLATYTPNAGFTGSDSFEYTIRDRQGLAPAAPALVTITVVALPPPPPLPSPPSSGGKRGGGAMDWFTALALCALSMAAMRRRSRQWVPTR